MQSAPPSKQRPRPALDTLMPLAERVEALARSSGRAFIERDSKLASSLLADDGEHARLETALERAWMALLDGDSAGGDVARSAGLVAALETISDLSATICGHVVGLNGSPNVDEKSAIRKLAEMVPDMLAEALDALRANDERSARSVLHRAPAADACFAQSHLDLFENVQKGGRFESTQRLQAVTSAFERIGDGATDIARFVCDNAALEAAV
jgi:phosphate uptake regulator